MSANRQQMEFIEKNYQHMTRRQLSDETGLTFWQVCYSITKMGLRKRKKLNEITKESDVVAYIEDTMEFDVSLSQIIKEVGHLYKLSRYLIVKIITKLIHKSKVKRWEASTGVNLLVR